MKKHRRFSNSSGAATTCCPKTCSSSMWSSESFLISTRIVTDHDLQKSADRGSITSVTVQFGFMETPNVEEILEDLADHQEIRLPKDPHTWMVHATHENIIPAPDLSRFDRFRFRLFSTLRQISRPAYYYYGMGNKVQLSVEILPVRLRRT